KRAKTEDEKEQRRIERVLRNRAAAQTSRERKRLEVEKLESAKKQVETENGLLLQRLAAMEAENRRLAQQIAQLQSQHLHPTPYTAIASPAVTTATTTLATPVTLSTPPLPTLSPALFERDTTATAPALDDITFAPPPKPVPSATASTPSMQPDASAPGSAAVGAVAEPRENPDLTQHPAAMLCDLQSKYLDIPQFVIETTEADMTVATPPAGSQPEDDELERALRSATVQIYQDEPPENLTVKRVRAAAEQQLGLAAGFFKESTEWKARSSTLIRAEVEAQEAAVAVPAAPQDEGDGSLSGTQEAQDERAGEKEVGVDEGEDEDEEGDEETASKPRARRRAGTSAGPAEPRKRRRGSAKSANGRGTAAQDVDGDATGGVKRSTLGRGPGDDKASDADAQRETHAEAAASTESELSDL
ncbi:hypothetical protein KEM52_002351, partial [Ascosphaera acerosa]